MKTLPRPAAKVSRSPDFSGRPRRIDIEKTVAVKGHGKLNLRPIEIGDEKELIQFHEAISEEYIYLRYFEYLGLDQRTGHERLTRICTNTPESYAIVAEKPETAHHGAAILAVGRLTTTPEGGTATFDTLLTDGAHTNALGKILLQRLIKLARAFGFSYLKGELLVADHDGLNLCLSLGFSLQTLPHAGIVIVSLPLQASLEK